LKDSHAKHFQKKLSGKGSHIALLPTIVGQVFGFVNDHRFQILSYLRITDLLVLFFFLGKRKENRNQITPGCGLEGMQLYPFKSHGVQDFWQVPFSRCLIVIFLFLVAVSLWLRLSSHWSISIFWVWL
jgi:hypothetical protein